MRVGKTLYFALINRIAEVKAELHVQLNHQSICIFKILFSFHSFGLFSGMHMHMAYRWLPP